MPIEIRELIIKTEVRAQNNGGEADLDSKDLAALKEQIAVEAEAEVSKGKGSGFKR